MNISYKIKFIDSFRFMSSPLSGFVDNLSDGLYSYDSPDCKSELDMIIKNNKVIFRCFECKKNYSKDFDHELIKRFANVYEFCNEDVINKFMLLLRKGIYLYEYMDSWEKFDEILLPDKKHFNSKLTIENITDVDHRHARTVFKSFNNKHFGDYHDLYVHSDTLLLADVFENFRDQCVELYELDPANFLTAPGLAWQACLKISEIELKLLTDIDILLMVEKGIRDVKQYIDMQKQIISI